MLRDVRRLLKSSIDYGKGFSKIFRESKQLSIEDLTA
jgi:hypothetical protein